MKHDLTEVEMDLFKQLLFAMDGMDEVEIKDLYVGSLHLITCGIWSNVIIQFSCINLVSSLARNLPETYSNLWSQTKCRCQSLRYLGNDDPDPLED